MKLLRAKVVDGHVDVHGLGVSDGSFVGVLLPDEEPFELSEEQVAELQESIAEADRGDVVDGWQLLRELKR